MDKAPAYGAGDSGFESQVGLIVRRMRGAMAARRIPDPKVAGSIPVVFTDIRCSIVASIPACHAGDPGSIPGGGVPSHRMGARMAGGLAQTVERCVRNAEVAGSIPASSTQTATLRGEYRVPSDPRSQAPSGPVSTIVGDQIGSPGAVCMFTRRMLPYSLGG